MLGNLRLYLDLLSVDSVFQKQARLRLLRESLTIALCQIIPLDDVIFGRVQRNRLLWSELLFLGFSGGVGHGGGDSKGQCKCGNSEEVTRGLSSRDAGRGV